MKKPLIPLLMIILACLGIFAQENGTAKPRNATDGKQTNYSESIPYLPFMFERRAVENQKKDISDKNTGNNQQSASRISVTTADKDNDAPTGEKAFKIPVSVFNQNGTPVMDLTKADFKIFINGAEQQITDFEIEDGQPLNVFLILDTSRSMVNSMDEIKHFATELTASLKPEDKVQIIQFGSQVKVLGELTNDRRQIEKAIRKLDDGYGTALYDAIRDILQKNIKAVSGRKAVLLLSDGIDTSSFEQNYESSLVEAERSGVPFYIFYLDTYENILKIQNKPAPVPMVYPGKIPVPERVIDSLPKDSLKRYIETGKQFLLDLVWLSGGKAFGAAKISESKKADFDIIPTVIKPQYIIGITLPITKKDKRRQIKVRVNRPNLKIQARGSLIVGNDK